MTVSIIVAASSNNVIGKDNDLIWYLPDDMKFFKEKTLGHHVIMGRKNFESIPEKYRPLPNRTNIILSRDPSYIQEGCICLTDIEEALSIAQQNGDDEAFIIGGGEIYNLALEKKIVNKIYLTRVNHEFDGDTYFPKLKDKNWEIIEAINHPLDNKHLYSFTFCTYLKKK